jgi:hypothetical protein
VKTWKQISRKKSEELIAKMLQAFSQLSASGRQKQITCHTLSSSLGYLVRVYTYIVYRTTSIELIKDYVRDSGKE